MFNATLSPAGLSPFPNAGKRSPMIDAKFKHSLRSSSHARSTESSKLRESTFWIIDWMSI